MDPIAVVPVTPPAPVKESQGASECKEQEGSQKENFDKKLKKELSLLAPETAPVADPAADAKVEDTLQAADATAVIDPAVAGLIVDPNLQPQNPVALQALTAANAAGTRDTTDTHGDADANISAIDATATERVAAERSLTERGAAERGSVERGATNRVLSDREMKQRVAGDVADAKRAALEAEESDAKSEKFSVDSPKDVQMPVHGVAAERLAVAAAAGAQGQSAGSGAPADGLSSLSLLAHRSGAAQGAIDIVPSQVTARIDTPLGAAGWGDAFQQKIMFLVDRHQQSAELHINPPHLGPVDIMLNLTNDTASLAFVSPHAAVREAIQASLPDLQTALNQRGMEMAQAMVSADSSSAREQFSQAAAEAGSGNGSRDGGSRQGRGGPATGPLTIDAPRRAVAARGLVDIFA